MVLRVGGGAGKEQSAKRSEEQTRKYETDDDDDADQDDGGSGVFAKRGEQRNYSGYWMSRAKEGDGMTTERHSGFQTWMG